MRMDAKTPSEPSYPYECSILLPLRDGVALTRRTLEAIVASTAGIAYEIVLVDDGTTDGTADLLALLSGDVRIVRNQKRTSFAAAYNVAAKLARSPCLVFLRHDTVPIPGWLGTLLDAAKADASLGVVGSRLVKAPGVIQHAGIVFSRENRLPYHCYERWAPNAPEVCRRRAFQAVTAAGSLTPRALFESLGGFDEGFRDGYEDVDYCLRVRAAGRTVVYEPRSVLEHREAPAETTPTERIANRDRLVHKHRATPLVDEDVVLVEDGYARVYGAASDESHVSLRKIEDPADGARQRRLADAEAAALAGDRSAVRALAADPDAWPDDPSAQRWAGVLCGWAGDPVAAERFWLRALAAAEAPDLRAVLARQALARGNREAASAHIDALLAFAPADPEGWFLRGVETLGAGRYDEAATAFESALLNGAEPRKALLGQGMALLHGGDAEVAFDVFAAVVAENADDSEALNWLLRAGSQSERWDDLAETLTERAARNPTDLGARYALAAAHVRRGDARSARRELSHIARANPRYVGLADLQRAVDGLGAQVSRAP